MKVDGFAVRLAAILVIITTLGMLAWLVPLDYVDIVSTVLSLSKAHTLFTSLRAGLQQSVRCHSNGCPQTPSGGVRGLWRRLRPDTDEHLQD